MAENTVKLRLITNNEIDDKAVDSAVGKFGESFKAKDPEATAAVIESEIVPFLEKMIR